MRSGSRRSQGSSSISPFRLLLLGVLAALLILIFFTLAHDSHVAPARPLTGSSVDTPKPREKSPTQTNEAHYSLYQPPIVQQQPKKKPKIAYAITVTKDGPFVDGALVLGYAAKKYHNFKKGFSSAYDVDLVAFAAPPVKTTIPILEKFGWKVLKRQLPVALDEIQNKAYAEKMRNSGCCGADEFLKLWAFTLTDYHRVIHLDMDSIIYKNMDEIFNLDYELLYTGDYNMKGNCKYPPVQGGFLVIKPSLKTFEEFQAIIRKGNYGSQGWEGSKIGNYWGGQTIQGILPYYYNIVHPGTGKELNRCVYNCMVDNPYRPNTRICQDGHETCEDCRLQKPEMVSSAHFTICQKPWTCTRHTNPRNKDLCTVLHSKWFDLRNEFESELGIDTSYRTTASPFKESYGMCQRYYGKYHPIPIDRVKQFPAYAAVPAQ